MSGSCSYVPLQHANLHNCGYYDPRTNTARHSLECMFVAPPLPSRKPNYERNFTTTIQLNNPFSCPKIARARNANAESHLRLNDPEVPKYSVKPRSPPPDQKYEPSIYDHWKPNEKELYLAQHTGNYLEIQSKQEPRSDYRRRIGRYAKKNNVL